jgi:hypothetical protein
MPEGGEERHRSEEHLDVGGGILPVYPFSLHRLGRRRRSHERPHRDNIRPLGRPHLNPIAGDKPPPNKIIITRRAPMREY